MQYIHSWLTNRTTLVALIVLACHAGLLVYGSSKNSPARDEVGHLTAGLSHLEMQKFDLYRVNPPLVRTIAAIPLWLSPAKRDWEHYLGGHFDRPEFRVGYDFIAANGQDAFQYFTYGRLICVPFSLLTGWICFRWGTELFGPIAGLLATTLWCFLPEAIGNGQMLTPDAAATSMGILFWYANWHWQRDPTWRRTLLGGIALGLAVLSKTTWLVAYPLLLCVTLVWTFSSCDITRISRWTRVAMMVCVSVYVLNLGYLFEGTGTRFGDFPFVSTTLSGQESKVAGNRFTNSVLGKLPVPLPRNFVLGIDVQKYEFDERDYDSYLRGTWSKRGWWYYYIYGLCIKTPLGALAIIFSGTIVLARYRPIAVPDVASVLMPGLGILFFVSSQTGFSHHLRYILPATPYLLLLGCTVCYIDKQHRQSNRTSRSLIAWQPVLITGCVGWSVISSLLCFPHSHSYFNEFIGGPSAGYKHMLNSNVDWGQDVHRVRDWLEANPQAAPLNFTPHCNYNIRAIGEDIPWDFADTPPTKPGWYAISVNQLYRPDDRFADLHSFEPVERVGYSTYIYCLSSNDIDSLPKR